MLARVVRVAGGPVDGPGRPPFQGHERSATRPPRAGRGHDGPPADGTLERRLARPGWACPAASAPRTAASCAPPAFSAAGGLVRRAGAGAVCHVQGPRHAGSRTHGAGPRLRRRAHPRRRRADGWAQRSARHRLRPIQQASAARTARAAQVFVQGTSPPAWPSLRAVTARRAAAGRRPAEPWMESWSGPAARVRSRLGRAPVRS